MHEQLYLAVSHIYGSRFRCLNMVKMSDVNNSDLKDTDLASLMLRLCGVFFFASAHLIVKRFNNQYSEEMPAFLYLLLLCICEYMCYVSLTCPHLLPTIHRTLSEQFSLLENT